ncbi:PiggyBac transposable element-derived protein 2 [Elysia marginata]|uniref:PiggyBac transposable element-derived protein 2 n=1 Tax=Elysia marginata TaxID=1093978 RepID=A0AAV4GBF6_9GAST|nr:PiggyBac transposable element-derived protein 2 [Elysia marginata]
MFQSTCILFMFLVAACRPIAGFMPNPIRAACELDWFTVNEVIDILEYENFNSAPVFIEPPDVRELTVEDSGDECDAGPSIFTGRQLRTPATGTLQSHSGTEILDETDSESDGNTDDTTPGVPSPKRTKLSVPRTKKVSAKQTEFRWRTADIKSNEQLQWEPEQPDVSQLPNSLTLVEELSAKGVACTGTIRANRTSDCPLVDIKQLEKQPRGTYDHKSDNSKGVVMARWNDNRVVTVMSNFYGVEPIQSASRNVGVDCKTASDKLIQQIDAWKGDDCGSSENCLYSFDSFDGKVLKAKHTASKSDYVDNLKMVFSANGNECAIHGESSSETWYAVLDYGTNYCNLHNLITGSGLDKTENFSEKTNDKICTQYSTADCDKY